MTLKLYIAGPYSQRMVLKQRAEERVAESGGAIEITSTWLDGEHEAREGVATLDEMARWAGKDIRDIHRADAFVQFVEWPSTTGGAHHEFEYAQNFHRVVMAICGPTENLNLFHARAIRLRRCRIHRETWPEMKAHLLLKSWGKIGWEAA